MSENMLGAVISAAATIVGAFIGIYATRLGGKGNTIQLNAENQSSESQSRPAILGGIIGGFIGGIMGFAAAVYLGVLTLSPTPTPVAVDTTDLYDDFNNTRLDGNINADLWTSDITAPNVISQSDGVLAMTNIADGNAETNIYSKKILQGIQYKFVETKILLSKDKIGGGGDIGLGLKTTDSQDKDLIYLCAIGRSSPAEIWCEVYGRSSSGLPEYTTRKIITNYDIWHTARIEVDPEVNVTFYIDGINVGTYQPPDAEELKNNSYIVRLAVFSPDQDGIKGLFDDVRIGQYK